MGQNAYRFSIYCAARPGPITSHLLWGWYLAELQAYPYPYLGAVIGARIKRPFLFRNSRDCRAFYVVGLAEQLDALVSVLQ
jgi:hypothetical protein